VLPWFELLRFELLIFFICQRPQKFSGTYYLTTKPSGDRAKIALVESHDRICVAVDGGFQNHIVIRVGQCGSPPKRERHTPAQEGQAIENVRDIFHACPRLSQMLWPAQNGLVFQHQRH